MRVAGRINHSHGSAIAKFGASHYLWKCPMKSQHNLIAFSYTFMYINPMFTAHIFFKNEPSSTCINFTLLSTCLKRFQKQTDLYILPVVWLDGLSQRRRSEQHSDEAKQESTSHCQLLDSSRHVERRAKFIHVDDGLFLKKMRPVNIGFMYINVYESAIRLCSRGTRNVDNDSG